MNRPQLVPRHRCAVLAAGAAAQAALAAFWLRADLVAAAGAASRGLLTTQPFDRLLVWSCAVSLLGCLGWLAVITALLAADAARGRTLARRVVPVPLARWMLGLCGMALSTGLAPSAVADAPSHQPSRQAGDRAGQPDRTGAAHPFPNLRSLALPDRVPPTTRLSRPALRARVRPDASAAGHDRLLVVEPGDTLWALARDQLGPGADEGEVARHCRAIHRANRSTIGADPDLIRPGQRIRLPQP